MTLKHTTLGEYQFSTLKTINTRYKITKNVSGSFFPNKMFKHSRRGNPLDKFEHRSVDDKNFHVSAFWREYLSMEKKL